MNQMLLTRTPQCGPVSCCCTMYWEIGAGETLPLQIDWQGFLATVPGYNLATIEKAELIDLMKNPPAPANDDDIKLVSGMAADPTEHLPGFGAILDSRATEFLVEASSSARVSGCYLLNICLGLVNCNGKRLKVCDCVNITVSCR